MSNYVHPIKTPQHSLRIDIKGINKEVYIKILSEFAQTQALKFYEGARDPQGRTIMIIMDGKNSEISSANPFLETDFYTASYANTQSPEDITATDDLTKAFEDFLKTKTVLTYSVEY